MPVVKKVVLQKDEKCEDCSKIIGAGNEAVKDRKDKKKGTIYHHTTCYKAKT